MQSMTYSLLHSIEPSIAVFPPTYVTSITRMTIRINNDTDTRFTYEWRCFSTSSEEKGVLAKCDLYDPDQRAGRARLLDFRSDAFMIDPMSSEVWPHRSQTIVLTFLPTVARTYSETAFLFDKETGERIAFSMTAHALPPDGRLDIGRINIGHIPLDSTREYQINFTNCGGIPFDFSLANSESALGVRFIPDHGKLVAGQAKELLVQLAAQKVGQFVETFQFNVVHGDVVGCSPSITFTGWVLGPSFELSTQILDFGTVGFGFVNSQEFQIENVSDIQLNFNLSFAHTPSFECREFSVFPSNGMIPGRSSQTIRVDFIPISVQDYRVDLLMHSSRMDGRLATIAIRATCVCPQITIENPVVDVGDVFIGHEYPISIDLIGSSRHPAKFEFVEATDQSILDATVSCGKRRGLVGANHTSSLPIYFTPLRLGQLCVTRHFRIIGSQDAPLPFTIRALCGGPQIDLSRHEVNFGSVPLLTEVTELLSFTNASVIPARFRISIDGIFRITATEGVLDPSETFSFDICAFLDDTTLFKATLTLFVDNLFPIKVPVLAKGLGTALVPSTDMSTFDFGLLLTDSLAVRRFSLANHGRRGQEVIWTLSRPSIDFVCSISPDQATISPRETQDYVLTVFCARPCDFAFAASCTTKQRSELFKPTVRGTFLSPTIHFENPAMDFEYVHDVATEELTREGCGSMQPSRDVLRPISKPNSVENRTSLPLVLDAQVAPPFFLDRKHFELGVGESATFEVVFDVTLKRNFESETVQSKIIFSVANNPKKMSVCVRASMLFPNLAFEPGTSLDFGSLMKHTEEQRPLIVRNVGALPVEFEWQLLATSPPVFDVYPLRGELAPGGSGEVLFTFFPASDQKFQKYNGTAICHVHGGGDYAIALTGSSADIHYKVVPDLIELGCQHYAATISSAMTLQNLSDVPFSFAIHIPRGCSFAAIDVRPATGKVQVNGSATFSVKVQPGLPQEYNEKLFIQIGHFDDAEVDVKVSCGFPQLALSLPRAKNDPILNWLGEKGLERPIAEAELEIMSQRLLEKSDRKAGGGRLFDEKQIKAADGFVGYIASIHELDFGPIVLGESKQLSFSMRNVTTIPVSCELLTKTLEGTGFSCHFTSFRDIQPDEAVSATFSFNSEKHSIRETGEVEYKIPVAFSLEYGYVVNIRASIIIPGILFFINGRPFNSDAERLEFEPTALGQSRTLWIQVQNPTAVDVEYEISPIQSTNVVRQDKLSKVFVCSLQSGVLPPTSFKNVEIMFVPGAGRVYSGQFPIRVRYNEKLFLISIRGTGVMLKCYFDPPDLTFDPILPFSSPSYAEFAIVNPTSYPIDVYSPVFDFQNCCDLMRERYAAMYQVEEEAPVAASTMPSTAARWAFCVVVHGPRGSGKSVVSRTIAKILGDIPILSLHDLWDEVEESEFEQTLRAAFHGSNCVSGFVIDGLDFFPEAPEIEPILAHLLKQRTLVDELGKNPFVVVDQLSETACERALEYVLSALEGHCLILVGLRCSEVVIEAHDQLLQEEVERTRNWESLEELHRCLEMVDDEYQALDPTRQAFVDQVRQKHRAALLETHLRNGTDSRRQSLSRRRLRDSSSSRRIRNPRRPGKKVPRDAKTISLEVFQFVFGRICNRARQSGSTFQVVNVKDYWDSDISLSTKVFADTNAVVIDSGIPITWLTRDLSLVLPKLEEFKVRTNSQTVSPPTWTVPGVDKKRDPENLPMVFTFVNDEPPGRFPVFEFKQVTRSFRRRESKVTDSSLTDNLDPMNYTKRWRIEPSGRERVRLKFSSDVVGTFDDTFVFKLVNCRDDPFSLKVHGFCGCPDIQRQPVSIFGKTIRKTLVRSDMAFIEDLNAFYFGCVLIGREKTGRNQQPLCRKQISLSNSSVFPSEVNVILESAPKLVWTLDCATVTVLPGQTHNITIGFNPLAADRYRTSISLFVRDNAEPLQFQLIGDGSVPVVDISSTSLDFEKILVAQQRTLALELKNKSHISAFWRVRGSNQLPAYFKLSATEGFIRGDSTVTVSVTFSSPRILVVKKPIQIDIMDQHKQKTFACHHVNLSAEAFDVSFDFLYPKNMDHLVFGPLIVGQARELVCNLRNHGKYLALFKFRIVGRLLRSAFKIVPMEGTLPPGERGIQVTFTVQDQSNHAFASGKGISLTVSEAQYRTPIGTLAVPFSYKTVYSQFSIRPEGRIDFGPLPIGVTHTRELVIENHGIFPFEFEITSKSESGDDSQSQRSSASSRRRGAKVFSIGMKHRRFPNNALHLGPFILSSSTGLIQPDTRAVLQIEFGATSAQNHEAKLLVRIQNSPPAAAAGSLIDLLASSHVPGILTNDFERIFPGQVMCIRRDIVTRECDAFLEDEHRFHFAPTLVGDSRTVKMVVINPYPVACQVDLTCSDSSVKPRKKTQQAPRAKKPLSFSLSDSSVAVAADSSAEVGLTFSPLAATERSAFVEVNVRGGTDLTTNYFKVGVDGTGALPSISLLGQNEKTTAITVNFGRNLVGRRKTKVITIINDGSIATRIVIDAKANPDFEIEDFDSVREVELGAGAEFSLRVTFVATASRRSHSEVLVSHVNSSKASLTAALTGEGFWEEIYFEGFSDDVADLVFKEGLVGRESQLPFSIRNVSQFHARFAFQGHNNFRFIPQTGHLHKGTSKKIIAVFETEKPIRHTLLKLFCSFTKIELLDPDLVDWDDSMRTPAMVSKLSLANWVQPQPPPERKSLAGLHRAARRREAPRRQTVRRRSTKKLELLDDSDAENGDEFVRVLEVKPEPDYRAIERPKDHFLTIFAIADHISYELSHTELLFGPTMMFDKQIAEFHLKNTSQVRFRFEWLADKFEALRTDYAKNFESPFVIRPADGAIEPGHTATFRVEFFPVEVDDFRAVASCDIPGVAQPQSPQVTLVGFSKRPVCHVAAELSDYLSAGRRHPDYTYDLPVDIRVIELFGIGIGQQVRRKFEVLNTTELAYEVFWKEDREHGNKAITCETERVFVSSGQHFMVSFVYRPSTRKLVEAVWHFTIPSHDVTTALLIVGRMARQ
jgi:hypothetical protein